MYTVTLYNQHSFYHFQPIHTEHFAQVADAQAYMKKCIDLDREVEASSCDEMRLCDNNQKVLETWAWCVDDIDAPYDWHQV
jgi:hypothetical protein